MRMHASRIIVHLYMEMEWSRDVFKCLYHADLRNYYELNTLIRNNFALGWPSWPDAHCGIRSYYTAI